MALKIDTKFEGKLTCTTKNDVRNLANFHRSPWKSQKWDPDGIVWSKVENAQAQNLQGSYVSWQWIMMQKVKRNCLKSSKLSWEFDKFWPELSRISKICTFMGCFWPKYIKFWVKKYRGVMFDGTEYWCKIWRKNDWCFQKWHEEFSKFLPEHVQKSKKLDFDDILLSRVENVWP